MPRKSPKGREGLLDKVEHLEEERARRKASKGRPADDGLDLDRIP